MALGAGNVQVCTAAMHHGYRIVEDLVEGLDGYLSEKGMAGVSELVGKWEARGFDLGLDALRRDAEASERELRHGHQAPDHGHHRQPPA